MNTPPEMAVPAIAAIMTQLPRATRNAVLATMAKPPLLLLLGSDAVRIVERSDRAKTAADKKWRHLGVSTDFAAV